MPWLACVIPLKVTVYLLEGGVVPVMLIVLVRVSAGEHSHKLPDTPLVNGEVAPRSTEVGNELC